MDKKSILSVSLQTDIIKKKTMWVNVIGRNGFRDFF